MINSFRNKKYFSHYSSWRWSNTDVQVVIIIFMTLGCSTIVRHQCAFSVLYQFTTHTFFLYLFFMAALSLSRLLCYFFQVLTDVESSSHRMFLENGWVLFSFMIFFFDLCHWLLNLFVFPRIYYLQCFFFIFCMADNENVLFIYR